jgi:hypothetical protein
MLPATYNSPLQRGQNIELETAWAYYVTNAGNPTAQAANLNSYASSLNDGISGPSILTIVNPEIVVWPNHGHVPGDLLTLGTDGTLPGVNAGTVFVDTVIGSGHFTISSSQTGGSAIAFTGSQSGNQYVSANLFTNIYVKCACTNWKALGVAKGVNKMFAYEGGFSPDLVGGTSTISSNMWYSLIAGATQASSCVLTLATTISLDSAEIESGLQALGNPAVVGMVLPIVNALGMTQLNCLSTANGNGAVTFTSGSASITWTNILIAGQCVQFEPSSNLPSNITPNTTYFISPRAFPAARSRFRQRRAAARSSLGHLRPGLTITLPSIPDGW